MCESELKMRHRKDSKPCPLENCSHHYMTLTGLEAHLFLHHRKNELIRALIKIEEEKGAYSSFLTKAKT